MSDKDKQLIIEALNTISCALADHNHMWTNKERKLYEKTMRLLT